MDSPTSPLSWRLRVLSCLLLCSLPQGCFKQPDIALDSLVLGSDFARPLKLPAGPLISHAITWLANKLGGGVSVNVTGQQPFILAPLIAAAQVVNVAPRGQEPDLLAPVEDLRLFDAGLVNTWTGALGPHTQSGTLGVCGGTTHRPDHQNQLFVPTTTLADSVWRCCTLSACAAGRPLTAKQRRSHFSCAASRKGRCFDTQHVWTFLIYEHILDYSTFLLNMPFFRLDMVQVCQKCRRAGHAHTRLVVHSAAFVTAQHKARSAWVGSPAQQGFATAAQMQRHIATCSLLCRCSYLLLYVLAAAQRPAAAVYA